MFPGDDEYNPDVGGVLRIPPEMVCMLASRTHSRALYLPTEFRMFGSPWMGIPGVAG